MNDSRSVTPISVIFDNEALIPERMYTARVKSVTSGLESPYFLLNFTMSKFVGIYVLPLFLVLH